MPWQECYKMDERLRFVARLLEGDKMTVLCREFGISRKTGYKLYRGLSEIPCVRRDSRCYTSEPLAVHDGELVHGRLPLLR